MLDGISGQERCFAVTAEQCWMWAGRWQPGDALGGTRGMLWALPVLPDTLSHWGRLPAALFVAVTGKSDSVHDSKGKRKFLSIVPLARMDCLVVCFRLVLFFSPSVVMILWCVMLDRDGCCPKIQLVSDRVLRDLAER